MSHAMWTCVGIWEPCWPPVCALHAYWQLHSPFDVSVTHVLHGKHRDLIGRPKIGHQLQIALCNAYGSMSDFLFIRLINVQSAELQMQIN